MAAPKVASEPRKGSSDRAGPDLGVAAPIEDRGRSWAGPVIVVLVAAVAALAACGYVAIRRAAEDPDDVLAEAQAELQANRFDRAEGAVDRLARLREPVGEDRMVRARLAVARNRPDAAVAELALVPDESPLAAGARLLAGQVEVRRDRFRFAEQSLRAAIRLDPRLIKAHRELIFIYGFQLRRAELAAEFLALSSLTDLRFQEMFHWGMLKNESWEPGSAAGKLARCIAADPDDRWSRLGLAENQRRMGHLDEAEATLAILAPDDPEAIAARVRIAMDRSDVEAAEHLMASGPPRDPALARLRGRLALSRRDASAAVRHFRVAYELQPDGRETVTGLMTALVLQGDATAAAPLREIAARLDNLQALIQRAAAGEVRNELELALQLGDACAALHRDPEARGWYRVAIARDPLNSRAQRALYRLGAAGAGKPMGPK
jgi:tetratricopeptide (TPR) repeat protein